MRDYLTAKILEYHSGLVRMGAIGVDFPSPNLRNQIHPVFHPDRWVRGHNQMRPGIYERAKPAFRLASLMITDESQMWWWGHLYHGDVVKTYSDDEPPQKIHHIQANPAEFSPQARQEARAAFDRLAKIITLMFIPRGYREDAWGITRCHACDDFEWASELGRSNYPVVPDRYTRRLDLYYQVPEIGFSDKFYSFYSSDYHKSTPGQRLRAHFMFAITLTHELAHAYWMFIGRDTAGREPLWNRNCHMNEMGFCWEAVVLGRVCEPLGEVLRRCHALTCMKTYLWLPHETVKAERAQLALKVMLEGRGGTKIHQIPCDMDVRAFLSSHQWRGTSYYGKHVPGMNFLCVVHAVPMKWIADWFREEEWTARRREWERNLREKGEGNFKPRVPPLGPSWTLVFQIDMHGQQTMWVSSR
jgi:hypothetical protein